MRFIHRSPITEPQIEKVLPIPDWGYKQMAAIALQAFLYYVSLMKDLTQGSIPRHVIEMAVPMAVGMLVQTL